MTESGHCRATRRVSSTNRLLYRLLVAGALLEPVASSNVLHLTKSGVSGQNVSLPDDWNGAIPLVVSNRCQSTIWPGIATQHGTGPGIGGFALEPGRSKDLWVSPEWQGRIWGRTNCTVNGDSCKCKTGDCYGKLDCEYSGATPATLVEFNLAGGESQSQTFYDISLVDGYNLPVGVNYLPAKNTTFIPPNLTNCACIATAGWLSQNSQLGSFYSNSTYPVPLESDETNKSVRDWCPWPLLADPPKKPGDGIYPYPDDKIQRPEFSPCNSACTATGSDKDCCVGKYHDPDICKPSEYSKASKAICPDAYSYAYDDNKSIFIIPKGGGFEIIMCPEGRSTNILRQLGTELSQLASDGKLSETALKKLSNATYVKTDRSAASEVRPLLTTVAAAVFIAGIWVSV